MHCVNEECQSDLIPFMVEDVQLDLCPMCKGFWFDSGELERCIEKPPRKISAAFGEVTMASTTEGMKGMKRKCPHCEAQMEKEKYQGGVWIDRCPDGHGLWLDSGEMAAIYQQVRDARGKEDASQGAGSGNVLADIVNIGLAALIRPFTKK